jgi:hypothetical protein
VFFGEFLREIEEIWGKSGRWREKKESEKSGKNWKKSGRVESRESRERKAEQR